MCARVKGGKISLNS